MVRDEAARDARAFVDGTEVAELTNCFTGGLSVEGFVIGNDQDSVLGGFDRNQGLIGNFYDLRIYNRSKTSAELVEIRNFVCKKLHFIFYCYFLSFLFYFFFNIRFQFKFNRLYN